MENRTKMKASLLAFMVCLVLYILACSSNSDPTDPDGGGGGGPPAGVSVSATMNGFFGDGYFSVAPGEWSTYKHHNRTYFNWYGSACSFCVQLPVGYNDLDITTPITWNVSRGGFCADNNYASVSIEVVDHDAPEGYDRFLAVTGELTFTEFDNENWIYVGTFEFRIGAFSTSDGSVFEYGGEHSLDTTFASGTFDSRIGGMVTAR